MLVLYTLKKEMGKVETEEKKSFKILLSLWNDLCLVNTEHSVNDFVNIVDTHTRTPES